MRKQRLEIGIPMPVTPFHQMKMIMAQLMLNDLLCFLDTESSKLMRTDLDIVGPCEIPPSCRFQPSVERSLVQERSAERLHRYPLYPLLQSLIIHT